MRPAGGGASGGSLRSSRQAAACHPFTRSWATMPPEPPPPAGLRRVGIVECLCFDGGMRPRLVSGDIESKVGRILQKAQQALSTAEESTENQEED